jgi:signal transduction histidine kinase
MRPIPDRQLEIPTQRGAGTLPADQEVVRELRGVLHDVGHGLATLSMLVDGLTDAALRGVPVPDLLDLVGRETARLLAVVHAGAVPAASAEVVPVRPVLETVASVARRTGRAPVRLEPGPDVHLRVDPVLLSRVVANLVDNAARAAGPTGRVDVTVSGDRDVVIDVVDDGPGYPAGPSGTSHLGLDVVTRLLAACGGRLEVDRLGAGGTRARVVLPGRVGRHRAGGGPDAGTGGGTAGPPASRCA